MKESKELTKAEPSAVALPADAGMTQAWDEEVDGIARGAIPQLKIAHPNCEDLPSGSFFGGIYNNLSGETKESWKVVLMAASVRNSLMPTYVRGSKEGAICKSKNGITPTGGSEQLEGPCRVKMPNGRYVETCPMLQWKEGPKGEKIKPSCMTQYTLLLIDLETMEPAIFNAKRAGTKTFEKLVSALKYSRLKLVDKENPTIPVECFVPIKLSTVPKDNYWLPTMDLMVDSKDRIDLGTARVLAEMQPGMKQLLAQLDPDDVVVVDEPSGNGTEVYEDDKPPF